MNYSKTSVRTAIFLLFCSTVVACGLTSNGTQRIEVSSQSAKVNQAENNDSIVFREAVGAGEPADNTVSDSIGFDLTNNKSCKCNDIWGDQELKKCKSGTRLFCDKDKRMAFQFNATLLYCWGGGKKDCDYTKLLAKVSKK